jgi:recombinational DNA repair protein (RecF pathway)
MAIEKYVTKGIVIESYDQGEHDRAFKIFTREFGLLICHAKSVRKLESKLRPHLMPRSCTLLTLVQGREVWRIVGAEDERIMSPYIHEVTALIRRFVKGEGAHRALYDRLMTFLLEKDNYDEQITRLLLYYVVLVELGYADAEICGAKSIEEYKKFSISDLYTHLVLTKDLVRSHVQQVLKEIQL